MGEKIPMQLNIGERFGLLGILPQQGNIVTLTTIRKLRESLTPTEKEAEEYDFTYEYECKQRDEVDGKPKSCGFKVASPIPPKCPTHDSYMEPTGMMFWKPSLALVEREILFTKKGKSLVVEALERLNNEKRLIPQQESIYRKFITQEEEEEE